MNLQSLHIRVKYLAIILILSALRLQVAYADQSDAAPLPDDVVQNILAKVKSYQDPTAKRLRQHLEETFTLIAQIEADEASLTGNDTPYALRSELRALISAKLNQLASMREEVRSRFAETRGKLANLDQPEKVDAWDDLKAKVEARFDTISGALGELRDSGDAAAKNTALAKVKALLYDFHEKVLEQKKAPGNMPSPTFRRMVPVAPSIKHPSKTVPRY